MKVAYTCILLCKHLIQAATEKFSLSTASCNGGGSLHVVSNPFLMVDLLPPFFRSHADFFCLQSKQQWNTSEEDLSMTF